MTKKDRNMILVVLGAVMLLGFWFLLLTPQRKASAAAEASLQGAKTALDAAQQKLTAGRQAQQAFRRDRTTIVKLGRVVPETDDIPTLLTQLEVLAKREKVDFISYSIDAAGGQSTTTAPTTGTSTTTGAQTGTRTTDTVAPLYSPGSVEVAGGLGRTPIALTLKGQYFNLERYLRSVQRFAVLSAKQTTAKGRLIIVDGFSYIPDVDASAAVQDGEVSKSKKTSRSPKLTATLSASVYFAPPLQAPSATSAATGATGATPAATPDAATPSTSTGAATVGVLR